MNCSSPFQMAKDVKIFESYHQRRKKPSFWMAEIRESVEPESGNTPPGCCIQVFESLSKKTK